MSGSDCSILSAEDDNGKTCLTRMREVLCPAIQRSRSLWGNRLRGAEPRGGGGQRISDFNS